MQSSDFSFIYSIYPKHEPTYTFIIRMFAITREPWQFPKMLMTGRQKASRMTTPEWKWLSINVIAITEEKSIYISAATIKFISGYVCVCVVQIRLQHNHFLWMSSPISPSESWWRGGTESVSGSSLLSSSGRAGWAQFGWCTQSVFLKKKKTKQT